MHDLTTPSAGMKGWKRHTRHPIWIDAPCGKNGTAKRQSAQRHFQVQQEGELEVSTCPDESGFECVPFDA